MSPFDNLLLAHLVGDYLLQTSWMAINKTNNWLALSTHSAIYTLVIGLAALIFVHSLSWSAIALIFCAHMLLDRRYFVRWWLLNIMRVSKDDGARLGLVVDQTFHLIILAVALYL